MEYQILIVDDDKDLSWIIAEMLQDYGYKVLCAADSAAAFEMLEHIKVHLILLDINLPDTDGFVFCRELRRLSGIPVIFASARTSENDKIEGFELGADDYLSKPYSMKELLCRVNALIRRTYGANRQEEQMTFGNVQVNFTARTVTKEGKMYHCPCGNLICLRICAAIKIQRSERIRCFRKSGAHFQW